MDKVANLDKVEELISHLGSNKIALRHRAIWELGQQADARAIKPLMDLLPLSDSRQHSLILAAISEIGLKTFKPMKQLLAVSLNSPNPDVRKNAIRDLQRLYEAVLQSSQLLTYALNDPDPEVQETAEWALEQMDRLNHSHIPHHLKHDNQAP
jgi:HEAT repeat protein